MDHSTGSLLPRLIDEQEAAKILGLSVKTLRRWRWAGRGPTFRMIGGAVRYHPMDLDNFIDAGRRDSTLAPERSI
jgi:predicted site-specific integrase-resolvase